MFEFFLKLGEAVRPFVLAFAPIVIVVWGVRLIFRIINQSEEELERGMRYYFDRLHFRDMKRQRRKAYWRLLKYKLSKRRASRKSPAFQKGDYFYDYLHKD